VINHNSNEKTFKILKEIQKIYVLKTYKKDKKSKEYSP
jgi:hypothetical protein